MVAQKILKALVRPGGPASMLPTVKGLAAAGIKKAGKAVVKAALNRKKGGHPAIASGALINGGSSVSKGNMARAISEMKGKAIGYRRDYKMNKETGKWGGTPIYSGKTPVVRR